MLLPSESTSVDESSRFAKERRLPCTFLWNWWSLVYLSDKKKNLLKTTVPIGETKAIAHKLALLFRHF